MVKRTSVYINNTCVILLCNHKLRDFAMAFRDELRKVEEILAMELNEYICEFIISVRTKAGKGL